MPIPFPPILKRLVSSNDSILLYHKSEKEHEKEDHVSLETFPVVSVFGRSLVRPGAGKGKREEGLDCLEGTGI